MSPQRWATLTEEQQGWVRKATERAGTEGRALHAAEMEAAMAQLSDLGVTVTEPDRDAFLFARDAIVGNMEGNVWPEGLAATIGDM